MATKFAIVAEFAAEGGPVSTGVDANGNRLGPTNKGKYVIARCGKHSNSRLYKTWSTLPWGTPLREHNGDVEYKSDGSWKSLTDLWKKLKVVPAAFTSADTKRDVQARHDELYGTQVVPTTWVFNDFGHMTCYYFKDLDGDRKLDKGTEKISSEFIHTTPDNEAQDALSQTIVLDKSHGCVHVKPDDIDTMMAKGYLAKGNTVVVHTYTDIPPIQPVENGRKPFQVHFYPGFGLIQVRGRKAK
jgi:hypothetical protein